MSTRIYDAKNLIGIKVVDKRVCVYLTYVPARQATWLRKGRPEGFETLFPHEFISAKDLEQGRYLGLELIVENKKVYYKPYVKLLFNGDLKEVKEFDNYTEAVEYANKMAELHIGKQSIIKFP